MTAHNSTPVPSNAEKMKKMKYFSIALLLCLGAIATLYILLHMTDLNTIVTAAKIILLPALLCLISVVLLLLSLYFFQAGRKIGTPKKHVRFL